MLETLLHPMCLGNADNPKKKKKRQANGLFYLQSHVESNQKWNFGWIWAGNDFDILLLAHVVHYVTNCYDVMHYVIMLWRACKRYVLYA